MSFRPGSHRNRSAIRKPDLMSSARRNRQSRIGFALLESCGALFLITIGLLGVFKIYFLGLDHMRALDESAVAMASLQNEMEALRAVAPDALPRGDDLPFTQPAPELEQLHLVESGVTVTPYNPAPLVEVTVRVEWTGEHGRRIEKRLTTLMQGGSTDE